MDSAAAAAAAAMPAVYKKNFMCVLETRTSFRDFTQFFPVLHISLEETLLTLLL